MRKAQHCLTNLFASFKMMAQNCSRNCLLFGACPALVACLIWGYFHCRIKVIQGVVSWIPVFTENEVNIYMQFRAKEQNLNFLLNIFISLGKQSF